MSKVYGIFYDDQSRVMIGTGGQVAGQNRTGYHLPGGTAKGKGKGKDANLSDSEIMETLWRELREEFGDFRADECNEHLERKDATKIFNRNLDGHKVYFVVCLVPADPLYRFSGRIIDADVTNPNDDTPFEMCKVEHRDLVIEAFLSCRNNWFVKGLECISGVRSSP